MEVNGIRVNYRIEGAGERWVSLRYDLRGHGGTQATQLGGPPDLMRALADKVPGARHVPVPGAAHIANIQNPAGFNQVLREFLG